MLEALFLYILISRFSWPIFGALLSTFLIVVLVGIHRNKSLAVRYNFVQKDGKTNEKTSEGISIYKVKRRTNLGWIEKLRSIIQSSNEPKSSCGEFSFALPQDLDIPNLSRPCEVVSKEEFIERYEKRIKKEGKVLMGYCIDPNDLSIYLLECDKKQWNDQLKECKYNYTMALFQQKFQQKETTIYRVSADLWPAIVSKCTADSDHTAKSSKPVFEKVLLLFDSDPFMGGVSDYLGHMFQFSSKSIQFISNHSPWAALQFYIVQLKRLEKNDELKQMKRKLLLLLHQYFLWTYNELNQCKYEKRPYLIWRMRCHDIYFWNEFLKPSLPGVKHLFVYQSLWKSVQCVINKFHDKAIPYFLSLFGVDDMYRYYCDPSMYFTALQECANNHSEFHSRSIYLDNFSQDYIVDVACEVLSNLIYAMFFLNGKHKRLSFETEKHNDKEGKDNRSDVAKSSFSCLVRYDTDICNGGVDMLDKIVKSIGWDDQHFEWETHKEKIDKILQDTKSEPFYPSVMTEEQIKKISWVIAQYEGIQYVSDIQ
ncbi:hypothetical protein RFI_13970 [Reticulomyxa filosa]|uniref:Uncharacterized protein n=1 Tax=Reticulomyxa filosa TaxID=46433 RepID=X6ND13_RETFI|nr:hypothetical protein RFI_13970 [Reticulomyxa filosa]|eukprot:ETO23217.1 hypothetical protein RFI_13970 [Reticulomyxa filosa]